ncbi:hypothetical protein GCM10022393_19060 [Aquimarina addita]|uniref:Uncharacterized protein n=1 Tax=Aquimarina addita TaxID=870485 RepID=A0ABP6UKJ0_9FLAO
MQKEILDRIKLLGGNIDAVTGKSFSEDILSITFDTVLYKKPTDTPWAKAEDEEPIYGIGDFIEKHLATYKENSQALYDKIIDKYYRLTKEGFGQMFWVATLFTLFKEGTDDFIDQEEVDLKESFEF